MAVRATPKGQTRCCSHIFQLKMRIVSQESGLPRAFDGWNPWYAHGDEVIVELLNLLQGPFFGLRLEVHLHRLLHFAQATVEHLTRRLHVTAFRFIDQ